MFNFYKHILFILIVAFVCSCASQSALQGGPKDETPPVLQSSIPLNKSTNFHEKEITFYFNEFIQLKSIQQKFVISPPLKEKPKITVRKKEVIVEFNDSLIENTTYNMNFADAIADLNEGNSINNFAFSISTGSTIDSLKISGKIIDAEDLKPQKDFLVMLYSDTTDSAPIKNIPYYISRTDGGGSFQIDNIKSGRYKIFALLDGNSNMQFDMPTEKIAFSDTIIIPKVLIEKTDTIDSLNTNKITYTPNNIILYSFNEDRNKQFVKKTSRAIRNRCNSVFNKKNYAKVKVESENVKSFLTETNKNNDSLTIWLLDSADILKDSIFFKVTYLKNDSLNNLTETSERLKFYYNNSDKKTDSKNIFNYSTNFIYKQLVSAESDIILKFSNPVKTFLPDSISVEETKDSVYKIIQPQFIPDSLSPRIWHIKYKWKEGMSYKIVIGKNKIFDIYNNSCDSALKIFRTNKADYYSTASFIISGNIESLVFQLNDASGNIIKKWKQTSGEKIKFTNLNPGKYKLFAFTDKNNNMQWDSGFYIKHIQPESKLFYNSEINLRSNWEVETKWDIKN